MNKFQIKPISNFTLVPELKPRLLKGKMYEAQYATNQPNWKEEGKVFVNGVLLTKDEYTLVGH